MSAPSGTAPTEFLQTFVLVKAGTATLEEAASAHGMSVEEAALKYVEHEVQIDLAYKELELRGTVAEIVAMNVTTIGVGRLREIVTNPASSSNAVIKATELAHRVSGIESRRNAELRNALPIVDDPEPCFLRINVPGREPIYAFKAGTSEASKQRWLSTNSSKG